MRNRTQDLQKKGSAFIMSSDHWTQVMWPSISGRMKVGDAGGCCDGDPYLFRRLKRCEEAKEQALVCSAWSRRAAYGLTHLKRPCGGRALTGQGTTHPSPHNCGTWPVSPAHSSDDMHACDCAGHVTYHGATVHERCEAPAVAIVGAVANARLGLA